MKVRNSWVHDYDRRGLDDDGFVDLDRLAGGTVRMSTEAASQVLGTTRPTLRKLIELKLVIKGEWVGKGSAPTVRWVLLDPADTRRSLYEAWVTRLGVPTSHDEFDRYLRAREVCKIPPEELPPANIVEGMLPFLIQLGSTHPGEIGAFTPTHRSTHSDLLKLIQTGSRRIDRRRLPPGARPTADMVLAAAPALRSAPATCFELPSGAEDFAKPSDAVLRQVWTFGPLRAAALLWVHLAAASYRRSGGVQTGVKNLRLLDDALTAQGPDTSAGDPLAITTALECIASTEGATTTASVRARACLAIGAMIRDLRLYASLNDSDGSLGLATMVPAQHCDRLQFTKRLRVADNDISAKGRAKRKKDVEEAADRFEELTTIAALRTEQIVATSEDALEAARELLKREHEADGGDRSWDREKYVGFSVPTTVMAANGNLLAGAQHCHWRAWRERDLWRDMAAGKDKLTQADDDLVISNTKIIDADPTAFDRIVFEWRGCTPIVGNLAIEPWFVSISNSGALIAAGSMKPELRARRHQMIVDWTLPAYAGSATGLLNFDRMHSTLWRYMADRGRHVVPVEQFSLAMRFAHLGFSAVDETICRLSEFLQMRQDGDIWPISGETGQEEVSFLAIPKTNAMEPSLEPVPFGVSQELFLEATTLAADVARLGGNADGILDEIPCAAQLSDKYPEPQAWMFQFGGQALRGHDMNRFLAFLLSNVVDVTFHDLRHASASAAECAGVPLASLQRLMNHSKREMTSYYAGKTERRQQRVDANQARRRKDRIIRLDAGRKPVTAGFDI